MTRRRTTIWAALAGLIVVGSALLVGIGAASGLHPLAKSGGAVASSQVAEGVTSTNYTVTFTETGLAASSNWSVSICITQYCEDDDGSLYQYTNNSSVSFSLANGTYYYHVHAWNDTRANPSYGNFTVAGASPAPIAIRFGNPTTYVVTFAETGLPAGTEWAVAIDLGWWSNSWAGQGGPGNWNDKPAVVKQDGGGWGGDGGSSGFNMTNNTSIQFFLPNGTYNYSIPNVTNFSVVGLQNGTINVSGGSPPTVKVVFSQLPSYSVTFTETGLPNGTNWSVSVHGAGEYESGDVPAQRVVTKSFEDGLTTANTSMSFLLPNGTYRFSVETVDGYVLNSSFGTFNVSGGAVTIALNFTALPEYNVTFNESGLPNGTDWGMRLVGNTGPLVHAHGQKIHAVQAARGLVTFHVPAGKYHYKLIQLKGWKSSGGFRGKAFRVSGAAVSTTIVFAPKSPKLVPAVTPVSVMVSNVVSGFLASVRTDLATARLL